MRINQFVPLETQFTTNVCGAVNDYTLTITYEDGVFMVRLSPEFNNRGLQNFNGFFPRRCKTLASAKSSGTKFVGEKTEWTPVARK